MQRVSPILISSIDQLTKEVGDASYLILDPDLDTYYMMDTVLLKMPENQALLFQILLLADETIDNQASTPEREAQLVVLIGRLETNLTVLDRNIQTALQNNLSGTMQPLVDAPRQDYVKLIAVIYKPHKNQSTWRPAGSGER